MTLGEILIGSCIVLSLLVVGIFTYLLAVIAQIGKEIGLFE